MGTETWRTMSVAEVATSVGIGPFGSRMKADRYTPSGVRVIRGNNIASSAALVGDFVHVSVATADELKSSRLVPDDLVFPHRGAIGEVGIVPSDGHEYMMSTSLMKLTCDPTLVVPGFIFHFFRSATGRHELLKNASTVGTPGIATPLSSLKAIRLPVPPLEQQRVIARILGALDDKIELNRKTNETLQAMARALFKSWFVDFDPVRAKMEGRRTEGMDEETAKLFPSEFEFSTYRPMPRGWREVAVRDIAWLNARTLGASDKREAISYVEISGVGHGYVERVDRFLRADAPSRARRLLSHGDTVLSTVRPERANYFVALHPADDLVASTGFVVLSPHAVPWAFLHFAVCQPDVFALLGHRADGGAYPAVHPETVGELGVVVPLARGLVEAFQRQAESLVLLAEARREQNRQLAFIRDTLLPKLMSGELRVRDAERAVEAAT